MFIECDGLVFGTKNVQFVPWVHFYKRAVMTTYAQAEKEHPCNKFLRFTKNHTYNYKNKDKLAIMISRTGKIWICRSDPNNIVSLLTKVSLGARKRQKLVRHGFN